jgi:agmatine deiminase
MAYSDLDTNIVYVSECLNKRYPKIYTSLVSALCAHGIKYGCIQKTDNIWARDFMPLQVDDHFIKFSYKGYGIGYDGYPWLKVHKKSYSFLNNVKTSSIILDGGNCQRQGDIACITDIVFKHNPQYEKIDLIKELERLLQAEIVIIPVEPGDDLGHTDGILKFTPSGIFERPLVLINDYSVMKQKKWSEYQEKLIKRLNKANIDHSLFPYAYQKNPKMTEKEFRIKFPNADDYNPAFGYYINFLWVSNLILMPTFGIQEDESCGEILRKYFKGCSIVPIDCKEISMEGGLINCITMNYKV